MKKSLKTVTALSALMMSATTLAAITAPELKVQGELMVPACKVVAGNNGVYDLGKLSPSLIKPTVSTSLSSKLQLWTVDCDAETFLSFSVTDNREGTASATGAEYFGLGNVNNTGKIGYYRVAMKTGAVDGENSSVYSTTSSSSFSALSTAYLAKGNKMGWAAANNQQKSGLKFSTLLSVEPVLASSAQMGGPVTDTAKLDGSMTLNFAFGL
ncbi:DUF1120 domain-containing protein [Providencia sp. JUb39]|uniref:DUF1120 domain-containing protein n=1 Tax=Providencia sp. JUb39 TaxID=2724165 RepID=UPI00164D8063|nr:DUF1120 domain-containing protein [Providencia sp. JUb39]MBC5791437.1 DUF1120 domain-containing protein [Providencia sp. JUb39]